MSEWPVVLLVADVRGEVERAAARLRDTGLRNPMVQLRNLGEVAAWCADHAGEIAFLITHADACRDAGDDDMQRELPAYPAFVVETVDGRLMASIRSSAAAAAIAPAPFDAAGVVRSLRRLGLRWLLI